MRGCRGTIQLPSIFLLVGVCAIAAERIFAAICHTAADGAFRRKWLNILSDRRRQRRRLWRLWPRRAEIL
jgi:hypothetical protein